MIRKVEEKRNAHQLYCDYEIRKAKFGFTPKCGTKPTKPLGVKYHNYTTTELKVLLNA